jgi:hypothetical protein
MVKAPPYQAPIKMSLAHAHECGDATHAQPHGFRILRGAVIGICSDDMNRHQPNEAE